MFSEKANLFLKTLNYKLERGRGEANRIVELLKKHDLEPEKILELGCGNGRVAIPLAEMGYNVVYLDISPPFIEDGRECARRAGV